ncbi:hypothetical protein ACFV2U_51350 [Streptomyces sp. NPDC059697]|uniref:hypothetical protein n=1 Tax=Streptomyces sp. NPDC059697 TaxID=3346912 RepID=UPI00369897BD
MFKMGEHHECHIPQPLGAHLRRRNPDSGPAVRGSSGRYRGSDHRIPASGRTRSDTFDIGVEDDDHQAVADEDHQAFAETVADEDQQAFAEAVADEDPQAEADSVEDAQVLAEAVADEDPQAEADSVEDAQVLAEADSVEDPQVLAEAEADSLEDEDGAPDRDRQADQDLLALTAGASDTPAPLRRGRVCRSLRPPPSHNHPVSGTSDAV